MEMNELSIQMGVIFNVQMRIILTRFKQIFCYEWTVKVKVGEKFVIAILLNVFLNVILW